MAASRFASTLAGGQCLAGLQPGGGAGLQLGEGVGPLPPALQGARSSRGLLFPSASSPTTSTSCSSRFPSFASSCMSVRSSSTSLSSSLLPSGHLCSGSFASNPLRSDPSFSRPRTSISSPKPLYPASASPVPSSVSTNAVVPVVAAAAYDIPTVADTKSAFLQSYKRPIPTLYNTAIQELLVQHHLIRWNAAYKYDAVTALGFVTVFDQLMEGYPDKQSSDAIFKAYVSALREDSDRYRQDATEILEWASKQDSSSILSFREGQVEGEEGASFESVLRDISERATAKRKFKNNRFFAVGLLTLAGAVRSPKPSTVDDLCKTLNVSKVAVDRDLDVYRNLLAKLQSARELLREFLEREKKKMAERDAQKAEKTAASPSEG